MSKQTASRNRDFQTVLRRQQQRVVANLTETETIEPTPIIRDDEALSCDEYTTLVYELHHVHLPELQAAGIVEFDQDEEIVRRGPRFDEARPLLEHGHDQ